MHCLESAAAAEESLKVLRELNLPPQPTSYKAKDLDHLEVTVELLLGIFNWEPS